MKKQVRFLLRNQKRRIGLLLVLCMLSTLLCGTVFTYAAEETQYKYTVRFLAGDKGTFSDDGSTVKVYTVDPSDPSTNPTFSQSMVTPKDGKYYVKGIREAGMDNSYADYSAPTIKKDTDFVVAYGIRGKSVEYTVEYVDEDGTELAPSETYYGNEGDRPFVAYKYIEGYFPDAYNRTQTLRSNSAENVFRFTYQPNPTEEVEQPTQQNTPEQQTGTTTTTTTTTTGGTAGTAGTAGGAAAAGGTAGAAAGAAGAAGTAGGAAAGAAGGAAAGAAGGAAAGAAGAEEGNLPATPQAVPEVIDQDMPTAENPGATSDGSTAESGSDASASSAGPTTETITEGQTPRAGLSGGAIAGIVVAIAAAAAAALFGGRYALNKKRANDAASSTGSDTYKFDDDGNLKKKD